MPEWQPRHAPEDEFRNYAVVSPVGRSMVTHIEQAEGGQSTPTAPWYDRTESTIKTVPTMRKDSTVFVITGDTARNKVQVMPGGTPTAAPVVSANGSPVSFNGREIVNSEHKKIAIYDASGKMVGRSNTHFSMRSLPSGVYMVYVAGYKGVACKVVKN